MASDWNDSQPIYRQLRDRVVAELLDGKLQDGDALPSVRQAAAELQINALTVLKGYQKLVDEGVIETRRGLGMFVKPQARAALLHAERARFLDEEWPTTLANIRRLGLGLRDLTDEGGVAPDRTIGGARP